MDTQRVVDFDCFFCDKCRLHIYNELLGEPKRCVPPRTLVGCLPSSWNCPVCGSGKDELRAVTMVDDFIGERPFGGYANKPSQVASHNS